MLLIAAGRQCYPQ
jgi:hypothetical protein